MPLSLCTTAKFKTQLGISGSGEDTQIGSWITAASAAIELYLGYPLNRESRTEYYDGTGCPELPLRIRPVTTLGAVYLDGGGYYGKASGAFAASTQLTDGTDFVLDYSASVNTESRTAILRRLRASGFERGEPLRRGRLTRIAIPGAAWPVGYGNIKVTYTAGVDSGSIPEDLQQACILLVQWFRLNTKTSGQGVASESLGGYSVSFGAPETATNTIASAGPLGGLRQLLEPWRRIVL